MTPSGIEPATFRIVAPSFNQLRHRVLQSVRLWKHIRSYNRFVQKYCYYLSLNNLCISKSLHFKHTSLHVSSLYANLGDRTLFRPQSLPSPLFPLYCPYPPLRLHTTRVIKSKTNRIEVSRGPLSLQEFEAPRIYIQSAHGGDEVVSPTHWSPLLPRRKP